MTREEFNKIVEEETQKEIAEICKQIGSQHYEDQGALMTQLVASAISASTNIVLSTLERTGVLKYED